MESIVSDVKEVTVPEDTSFGESIKKMDQHKKGIALIIDQKNRLLGILTEGDIRKAILRGIPLEENVKKTMNATPFCLKPGYADGEMIRAMMEHNVYHLPIIDDQKVLKGVIFNQTFVQQKVLLCPIVIMAGGLGSRLFPLTEEIPKPLLTVSGKPMI